MIHAGVIKIVEVDVQVEIQYFVLPTTTVPGMVVPLWHTFVNRFHKEFALLVVAMRILFCIQTRLQWTVCVLEEIQHCEVCIAHLTRTAVQCVMVETERVKLVTTVSNAPTMVAFPGGIHV